TTLAARVEASWSDSWAATIVVVPAATAHPEALDQLRRAASPHRSSLALVTTAAITDCTWRLHIDATGTAVLDPLGLTMRCALDAGAVADAATLLASAREPMAVPDDAADAEPTESQERRDGDG